ncbi:hypothetical protein GON03_07080 [Nocardioides sp. MAH-18]|uniref:Uncharacterized protein n=1 Tax=Nocardioides agri TaxID=2682843 RepID=A0A6L6XNN0_9ACTN|nr:MULTISPECIES: hypothetical protein [unclassified Nocardioides]MBA2954078.1 hypothetical protein [Nocardioides sp. CGMCC 1.13656]MVQ48941.1 hypothetical protein [Nocardioides sp. MAH-18]
MLLHDFLDDAVADVHADLPALVTASRSQGRSIRRRRRALSAVGAAAAVTLVAAIVVALVPGPGGRQGEVAADLTNPVRVGALGGETAPATPAGVVSALAESVDRVADGKFGRLQGEVDDYEALAALLFEPVGGTGPAGQVMINLQPLDGVGTAPYSCEDAWFEGITDCETHRLENGDSLRTYWQLDDSEFGVGSQRMAVEVLSPARHLRVVVNVLNTNPWAAGQHRAEPVLDLEQATAIATQPWWDARRLPVEYVAAGKRLDLFEG